MVFILLRELGFITICRKVISLAKKSIAKLFRKLLRVNTTYRQKLALFNSSKEKFYLASTTLRSYTYASVDSHTDILTAVSLPLPYLHP